MMSEKPWRLKIKYIPTSPNDPLIKAELDHNRNVLKVIVNTAHPRFHILDEGHAKFDRNAMNYECVLAISKADSRTEGMSLEELDDRVQKVLRYGETKESVQS